ncbi:hexokinase-1-like isoform X2 [Biomphalaria glabrata]|uniref:Phosphotransferase n=1 Tax=Biomphalaria glabrata TaxID=6526 RepID=A0A9W2YQU2_BIOGL|nr:hexokinase-1-like isoform X2 [Biomphalaria glabrata]
MPATTEQLTKYEKIETFVKGFKLSGAAYKRVMALLHQEMNNGLRKQSHTMADIKMFPTFVRSLPDGSEKGEFLALDLGGTNFRVLLVRLQAVDIDIQSKTYLIPQRIMLGTGTQNCKVEIVAVVNDAVGTLMSAAHGDRNCEIGLILGTGCNACYMEYLDNVGTWKNDEDHHPKQVIINTEWGAFGDNGCLDFMRTEYDTELDTFSINPGKQIMEKMISGMYMGEIVRLVLERLTREGLLFRSVDRECALFERGRFYTKYVSEIESDTDEFFRNTKQVLDELHVESYTTEDCKIVKYVCTLISARAAFLAAAGLATLINRLNKQDMTIAVDGSLYRFHPRFHNLMCLKIKELVKPGLKFKLSLSHDGSGKGAALTAAVSLRLRNMKLGGASSSSGDSTSNIACETVKVMA